MIDADAVNDAETLAAGTPPPDRLARAISVTDLYTIGIGPSSSHTVGPMRAGRAFARLVLDTAAATGARPVAVSCRLFGSLALTGQGHATDRAVMLGLAGWAPDAIDPERVPALLATIEAEGALSLGGAIPVPFAAGRDLLFDRDSFHPGHPNTLLLRCRFDDGGTLARHYHSIGGGVVVEAGAAVPAANLIQPYPFDSAQALLDQATRHGLGIAELVAANETVWRPAEETDAFLDSVAAAMTACIDRGCAADGVLPGGLGVRRRAGAISRALATPGEHRAPQSPFEWVSLWALAVNEENAAGGRVVTAPTNGAAGVLPAVLRYYLSFTPDASAAGVRGFLLTAAAIGFLYQKRASISAAEMGCQGEVGVACSMAAAALCAVLGGTPAQIENAAEIGMEHNLGLTCDPIGGLVQVPCIERNTMGAVKAINAAYLALRGDGQHIVSLDAVIETMRQTGRDMRSKYKETSLGGLAAIVAHLPVNFVEC